MSSRSIRRARQRTALPPENQMPPGTAHAAEAPVVEVCSEARLLANRHNAQLSTGPHSAEGKAASSLNALKTGLTGRTVLLPADDVALYEATLGALAQTYAPATDHERAVVQCLADAEWRLGRIPGLEAGIYALGRLEFASLFPEHEPAVRASLIDAKAFLTYGRQLNNLSVQEGRLRRQREKDLASLGELQAERNRLTRLRLDQKARHFIKAVHDHRQDQWIHDELGFEFSLDDVKQRAFQIEPALFAAGKESQRQQRAA